MRIVGLLSIVFGGCNGNRVNQTKENEAVKFEGTVIYEKKGNS